LPWRIRKKVSNMILNVCVGSMMIKLIIDF
jgi:hypothetical protein